MYRGFGNVKFAGRSSHSRFGFDNVFTQLARSLFRGINHCDQPPICFLYTNMTAFSVLCRQTVYAVKTGLSLDGVLPLSFQGHLVGKASI